MIVCWQKRKKKEKNQAKQEQKEKHLSIYFQVIDCSINTTGYMIIISIDFFFLKLTICLLLITNTCDNSIFWKYLVLYFKIYYYHQCWSSRTKDIADSGKQNLQILLSYIPGIWYYSVGMKWYLQWTNWCVHLNFCLFLFLFSPVLFFYNFLIIVVLFSWVTILFQLF